MEALGTVWKSRGMCRSYLRTFPRTQIPDIRQEACLKAIASTWAPYLGFPRGHVGIMAHTFS